MTRFTSFITRLLAPAGIAIFAFSAAAPTLAAPCTLEPGPFGGWTLKCPTYKAPESKYNVEKISPTVTLKMPDLIANDVDFFYSGDYLSIEVKSVNQGTLDSPGYSISAVVTATSVENPNLSYVDRVSAPVAGVPAGQDRRDHIGQAYVPNTGDNYTVVVEVTMDSVNFSTGGEVFEASELNNIFVEPACRIFGSSPDFSLGPCD